MLTFACMNKNAHFLHGQAWILRGHAKEFPTMHHFGIPRYTQSILTEYFWVFQSRIALWECCTHSLLQKHSNHWNANPLVWFGHSMVYGVPLTSANHPDPFTHLVNQVAARLLMTFDLAAVDASWNKLDRSSPLRSLQCLHLHSVLSVVVHLLQFCF